MILLILATATTFSWTLTIAYLPQRLVDLLTIVQATPWLFLMGSIALLIVLGSILKGLPALLILAPLLLPIASDMGISQLHFGIVLLIAMTIGAFTPPVRQILHFLCRAGHHGGAVLEGHGALFHHVVYRRGPGGPGPMVHYCVAQGVRSHHTIDALRHAEQREF